MPGYDGTGPFGTGPMGHGLGGCGFSPFIRRPKPRRLANVVPITTEKYELEYLQEEQKLIKEELQAIHKRIREIKDAKTKTM